MKNFLPQNIKNQEGSILVLVLLIFIIATIVCTSIMMIGSSSINMSKVLADQKKAHLLAWSGLEAVEVAWRDFSYGADKSKFQGDVKRVYYTSDGNFSVDEVDEYVGYVDLEAVQDEKKNYVIQSTGVVNKARQTIRSLSSPLETKKRPEKCFTSESDWESAVEENQWLITNKYTGCGDDQYAVLFLPGAESKPGKYNNKDYTLKVHPIVPGVVQVNPDLNKSGYEKEIYLYTKDGDHNKIGFIAHTIFFQKPINLQEDYSGCSSSSVGCAQMAVVVVSAENIIFEQELKVLDEYARFSGLALHLPPGLGVSGEKILSEVEAAYKSKVDPKRRYGRVYFNKVTVSNNQWGNNNFSDKSFYFLPDKDKQNDKDDAIIIYREDDFTYNTLLNTGRLIPIDKASEDYTPMQPEQYLKFVRYGGTTK